MKPPFLNVDFIYKLTFVSLLTFLVHILKVMILFAFR